jgi:hypothetical protein
LLLGVTVSLEMVVQLVVLEGLLAAVGGVGASEIELVEELLVELVDLARSLREVLSASLLVTDHGVLLSTLVANNILA